SDWGREEGPDAVAVYRRLATHCTTHGWNLPPLDAFLRRTRRELSKAAIERARKGALAVMDTVPHQTRTVAGIAPLDIINGDGREHDVMVHLPSGRTGRPRVWMWQDIRTRRILSWRAGETESADLVRTSLHDLITRWGVPGRVVVDSTRAASAKWMTGGQKNRRRWKSSGEELPGIFKMLEIDYRVTAIDTDAGGRGKGRGRSKPVERAFLDLSKQIDTHPLMAGAYTGRSTQDRPETHRTRVASWEDFIQVVERCVIEHNARTGRRTEAAAGRSFDAVWAAEYSATVVRKLTPRQAGILLLAAEPSRVDRSGCVRIKAGKGAGLPGNRYHHETLVDRAGEKVTVRFDPADLHSGVQVYDKAGRWICHAPCLMPVGFNDAAAAKEYEAARKKRRKAAEAELAAHRDMDALVAAMRDLPPAEEPEDPKAAAVGLVTVPAAAGDLSGQAPAPRKKFMAALRRFNQQED
ncbi:MAG: transposase, partial [Acidimicrobiaceae bacterium]|nr:transposase [Acidimicrobiaceae bacterium]